MKKNIEIKIEVNPNSSFANEMKDYMAEKAAFKKAVQSGRVSSFVKQNGIKFDTPISLRN